MAWHTLCAEYGDGYGEGTFGVLQAGAAPVRNTMPGGSVKGSSNPNTLKVCSNS